jgi:addiction module RelE/StbE family toxin
VRPSRQRRRCCAFIKSNEFTRQYERFRSSPRFGNHAHRVWELLDLLRTQSPIPARFCNHLLAGKWTGWNDAHIAPNLILLWRRVEVRESAYIILGALGTHAELGLE